MALVSHSDGAWRCIALAPSYDAFVELASGGMVDWAKRSEGARPTLVSLLRAARSLLNGERVTIVSVDMPLATVPITNRREADDAVARAFGKQACSPHSPNKTRPGIIADRFVKGFGQQGFSLAVKGAEVRDNQLIEVFPHPVLLKLLQADYRVPYKVAKTTRYWKDQPLAVRLGKLAAVHETILVGLRSVIDGIGLIIPKPAEIKTLASLKPYEDALDALVCAWVGIEHLRGKTKPYGDKAGAIWIPA